VGVVVADAGEVGRTCRSAIRLRRAA